MIVTSIEPVGKKRYNVFIDDEFAFFLYQSELNVCQLEEASFITEEQIEYIKESIILKRAKKKALSLLQRKDQTDYELRLKLQRAGYEEQIVEKAIQYLYQYRYVDDVQYTRHYFAYHVTNKSLKMMCWDLEKKGISRDIISHIVEEMVEELQEKEYDTICRMILRKTNGKEVDPATRKKLFANLYNKGFDLGKIQDAYHDVMYA